ncbi:MAG: hypothetical protein KAH09_07715 [Desulfobacula sp.]|nr:hypothetical protein [Desulfobacula sp.]
MEVTARRVRNIVSSDMDTLTGLANRIGFEKKLGMLLSDTSRIRRSLPSACSISINSN